MPHGRTGCEGPNIGKPRVRTGSDGQGRCRMRKQVESTDFSAVFRVGKPTKTRIVDEQDIPARSVSKIIAHEYMMRGDGLDSLPRQRALLEGINVFLHSSTK